MSILNDIKGLFLPPVCPVCGGELHEGEGAFCMMCRTLAPQTGFWRRADNPLAERLRNEFPVVQASAFLWFVAGSGPFMVSSITTAGARPATWVPGMAATLPTADCTEAWTASFPCRFIPGGCWPGGTIRLPISPRGSLPGWECRWRIGRSVACATTRARRPVLRPGAGRTYATCLRSRGPERWPDGTCCWSMTW